MSGLARRPRWGGGALRAFRWAEISFEAVLFESCVGEAAGSLAVASFFFFRGLGVVLGACWEPSFTQGQRLGSLGAHFGVLWMPFFRVFGTPLRSRGSPREPLSVAGELFGRSWAAVWSSGSLWGRPPGNSGKFWGPFWGHFRIIFHDFSVYFRVLFLSPCWELILSIF